VRSWPLLVLAAPAAAEVWSGWVGIAQKTGFGLVSPLPGIWPSLHLDTTITLPVGVEAYAAYALRAWLARDTRISARTRRFAKWSAISSFALGMAGQVAYHMLAQAGAARAPWPVTTIVSCLPVLVLAMGTALAHMLRADAAETDLKGTSTPGPAIHRDADQSCTVQPSDHQPDQPSSGGHWARSSSAVGSERSSSRDPHAALRTTRPDPHVTESQMDQARLVARQLAAHGKPVSRRALRSGGVKGSNETLNALAHQVNAELVKAAA
jgi:hypothetical protein